MDPVDAPGMFRRGALGDLLGGACDAADGLDHPDLVARADFAAGSAVTVERGARDAFGRVGIGAVFVGSRCSQSGRDIVAVDVCARRDVAGGAADRKAELQHRLTGRDRAQGDLVAARDRLGQYYACVLLAGIKVAQRRGDAVTGIDLEQGGRHSASIDCGGPVHTGWFARRCAAQLNCRRRPQGLLALAAQSFKTGRQILS
jgi:hypothetical protein